MKYLLLLVLLPLSAFGQKRVMLSPPPGPEYETPFRCIFKALEPKPLVCLSARPVGAIYMTDVRIIGEEFPQRQISVLSCYFLPPITDRFTRLFENKYTEKDFSHIPLTTFLAQLPEMRPK